MLTLLSLGQPFPKVKRPVPGEAAPVEQPAGDKKLRQDLKPMQAESKQMHEWWCSLPGNSEKLPCLMHAMRDKPNDERRELQQKLRDQPVMADRTLAMDEMHTAWCDMKEHAEGVLCTQWRERRGRQKQPKEAPHPKKSEFVDMHTAFCALEENRAKTPCLMHLMKERQVSDEERKAMQAKMKEAPSRR